MFQLLGQYSAGSLHQHRQHLKDAPSTSPLVLFNDIYPSRLLSLNHFMKLIHNLHVGKVETTTSTYKYKMQVQGEDSAPSTPSKPQQLLSLDGAKPHSVLQLPEQTHLQVNDDGPQQQEVASTQLNTSTQSSSASQEVGGRDEKETEIGAPISETDAAS